MENLSVAKSDTFSVWTENNKSQLTFERAQYMRKVSFTDFSQ